MLPKKENAMRRAEFEVTDPRAIGAILEACEYGVLSTIDGAGYPLTLPVNFVWLEGAICFHGATSGEKVDNITRNQKAGFCVTEALSLIPSYFTDPEKACGATQFFRSVVLKGTVCAVADRAEKSAILDALMQRFQPEGGYRPITLEQSRYARMLAATAVYRLTPVTLTAKVKLGQHLNAEQMEAIIAQLEKRGKQGDRQTAEMMRQYPKI
jgi:nitroimidazol reductase NimA-like FMN-containing flavoprotein (pyridoxamine 5'-phosphate oxidase superfamily)